MAAVKRQRPLSPHLQIYKMPLTAGLMSITHRITGFILAAGTVGLAAWLLAVAGGKETYSQAYHILQSPIGTLFLVGWTVALYYHLCNGIRHLFWDAGKGFELATSHLTGYLVILGAFVLAAITWLLVFFVQGGI